MTILMVGLFMVLLYLYAPRDSTTAVSRPPLPDLPYYRSRERTGRPTRQMGATTVVPPPRAPTRPALPLAGLKDPWAELLLTDYRAHPAARKLHGRGNSDARKTAVAAEKEEALGAGGENETAVAVK